MHTFSLAIGIQDNFTDFILQPHFKISTILWPSNLIELPNKSKTAYLKYIRWQITLPHDQHILQRTGQSALQLNYTKDSNILYTTNLTMINLLLNGSNSKETGSIIYKQIFLSLQHSSNNVSHRWNCQTHQRQLNINLQFNQVINLSLLHIQCTCPTPLSPDNSTFSSDVANLPDQSPTEVNIGNQSICHDQTLYSLVINSHINDLTYI